MIEIGYKAIHLRWGWIFGILLAATPADALLAWNYHIVTVGEGYSYTKKGGADVLTLKPGDYVNNGTRAMLSENMALDRGGNPQRPGQGAKVVYKWDMLLPSAHAGSNENEFDAANRLRPLDALIMQWRNGYGGPRTALHWYEDRLILRVAGHDGEAKRYTREVPLDVWVSCSMTAQWSYKDDGKIALDCGQEWSVVDKGPNIWGPEHRNYGPVHWSFGVYVPQWNGYPYRVEPDGVPTNWGRFMHLWDAPISIMYRNYKYMETD